MATVISHDFSPAGTARPRAAPTAGKVRWSGVITAIQPRGWVWRYKTDNRTHNLTGFNLWIDVDAGKTVVAISALQQQKLGFRLGDTASGTGWPVQGGKREIADLYRAGDLTVLERQDRNADRGGPPFLDIIPDIEIYRQRGCRMLDATLWRTACMSCLWANKSRVEIEYDFGKTKRHRSETFCYGPKSCPKYAMGEPREVPYKDDWPSQDDGCLDSCLTGHRGEDD